MKDIESAEEFFRLRTSEIEEEYARSAEASASDDVWLDVISRYPEMRKWVAHNKTVSIEILDILSLDADEEVRTWVAMRRTLDRKLFERLSVDPSPSVRRTIVTNGKAPFDIRASLLWDPDPDVIRESHGALARCKPSPETAVHSRELADNDLIFYRWLQQEIELAFSVVKLRSFENKFGHLAPASYQRPSLVHPLRSTSLRDLWLLSVAYFHDFSDGLYREDGSPGGFRGKSWAEARKELERKVTEVGQELGVAAC